MTLPVSVITGFLGSGKTTLLNRLLQHEGLRNSLVIINEFGEVGIDHLLVSVPADNMRLLNNGCVCCEIKGALVETLTEAWVKRTRHEIPQYDRVLIETTGLADPTPILRTVVADPDLTRVYSLDRVVTVVDALHALSQLKAQDEMSKQIALADVLLLSKADLVSSEALSSVRAMVHELNGGAQLLTVLHGDVAPQRLLGYGGVDPSVRAAELERWLGSQNVATTSHGGMHHSAHVGDIRTFTLFRDEPATESGLATWLSMLASFKGPQLLRVKGLVNVAGAPYVVQAVQTVIHEPCLLACWPSEDRRTRLVFIVRELEREAIAKTFAAFDMPNLAGDARHIDPEAYARFVNAAQEFLSTK